MDASASDRLYPVAGMWAAEAEVKYRASSRCIEDEDLMTRVQAGDEQALGTLVNRYGSVVMAIGSRILRDTGEVQELVQDVFLHVYRKCCLFDPKKGSFRSWLITIASHRALDRREYLNLHRFYDSRNLEDFMNTLQADCDLEYQAHIFQSEKVLRIAFESLNDKQRQTLELYFFEGYTLREISERLNESLGNTRHYYYRALDRLRASICSDREDD